MTDTKVDKIDGQFQFPKTEGRLVFVCGITTEAQARAWGEKHGYPIVYYWKQRDRAYAIKAESK